MICAHQETRRSWVEDSTDPDWGDPVPGHWAEETIYLTEDVDLHRWRCKRCGHVGYYSGAARAFYEEGERSDIPGLGGQP